MTPRVPDLDDLALLVLVAETGSIGDAARRRGLTQPSASRRMAALERALAVPVLRRGPRGTTLTPAGRVLVDWATTLLEAAEDFERSVATLRADDTSAVRAGVSMTLAEHHAPRWLAALRRRSPQTRVALTVANSTDVADAVESGRLELGLVESPAVRSGLRRLTIGADCLTVAVAPGHPWAGRDQVSSAELSAAPLLVREVGSGTRETVEHALKKKGLVLTVGLEVASNAALASAAVAGMGPVVLSQHAVATDLTDGRLVEVAVPELDLTRPFTAVWRPETPLTSGADALLRVVAVGAGAGRNR